MASEKLEKLKQKQLETERRLEAAKQKKKQLESEISRLTRSERTHRLCTRAGMLESFLIEPTLLTDDDVMELLTQIFKIESVKKKLNALIKERKRFAELPELIEPDEPKKLNEVKAPDKPKKKKEVEDPYEQEKMEEVTEPDERTEPDEPTEPDESENP